MKNKNKLYLYLDDVRTPKADNWEVVRNYDEFIAHIKLKGLGAYEVISLDHDLGEGAMVEYDHALEPKREAWRGSGDRDRAADLTIGDNKLRERGPTQANGQPRELAAVDSVNARARGVPSGDALNLQILHPDPRRGARHRQAAAAAQACDRAPVGRARGPA